ncbi:MAG: hypothetical protein DRN53_00075 [Thermoprotei archaeon]|nr:MAG: hypothetical protein DRN53_00075 [Thermoprotei archaeon]
MTRYIILLTGEHPTIPIAEIRAILQGRRIGLFEIYDQVVRLDTSQDLCKEIAERCAYVRACYREVFMCKAELDTILKYLRRVDFTPFIHNRSFAVRVLRIREYSKDLSTVQLEKKIGAFLKERFKAKVDLKSPNVLLQGILTSDIFLLGILMITSRRRDIIRRGSKYKPFTHPSALDPRIARAMVNMARIYERGVLLDPFSGTGTVVVESAVIGIESIGIDIDRRMIYGSLKNVVEFKAYDKCSLILADATKLPLRENSINAIVTDPPYGRSASTYGYEPSKLIENLLYSSVRVLKKGGIIVLMHPKEYFRQVRRTPLRVLEKHVIEVHSGLTRVISILKYQELSKEGNQTVSETSLF